MKTQSFQLIVLLAATLTAGAKEPKPPGDRRPPPPPQPLLAVLDTNRDGELSAEEITRSTSALSDLDKDGDGTVSRKELAPKPPKGKGGKLPPPNKKSALPILAALDLDNDGALSGDEIDLAPDSLATLDTDGDGTLSRKELKPSKPPVEKPE